MISCGLVIAASLLPSVAGEAVWEGPGTVACAVLSIGFYAGASGPRIRERFRGNNSLEGDVAKSTWAALCTAASLACFLLLVSRFSWLAVETGLEGRTGAAIKICVELMIGATLGGAVVLLAKNPTRRWCRWVMRGAISVLATCAMIGIALFVGWTGPHDLAGYPEAHVSPYRLPWRRHSASLCTRESRRCQPSKLGRIRLRLRDASGLRRLCCEERHGGDR